MYVVFCFFNQKTAYEVRISDWSSDVCSSDLRNGVGRIKVPLAAAAEEQDAVAANPPVGGILKQAEERGKARATGNAEDRTLALAQPEIAVRAINLERQPVDRPRKKPVGEQAHGKRPKEKAQTGRGTCRENVCQYV